MEASAVAGRVRPKANAAAAWEGTAPRGHLRAGLSPGAGSRATSPSPVTSAIAGPTSQGCCTDEFTHAEVWDQGLAQRKQRPGASPGAWRGPRGTNGREVRGLNALLLDPLAPQHVGVSTPRTLIGHTYGGCALPYISYALVKLREKKKEKCARERYGPSGSLRGKTPTEDLGTVSPHY